MATGIHGYTRGEVTFSVGFPDFNAAGKSLFKNSLDAGDTAGLNRAIFGLIVAGDTTLQKFALCIIEPDSIEAHGERVFEESFWSFLSVECGLEALGMQPGKRALAEIVEEPLCFIRGNLQGAREPAAQGAIEKGITDKEHEDDREEARWPWRL